MGEWEQLLSAFGQKGFIGGDQRLFRLQRGFGNEKGVLGSADQLNDDLHGGVGDYFFPILHRGNRKIVSVFGGVSNGDTFDLELHPESLPDQGIGLGKVSDQARSDRSATDYADANLVHSLI